MGLCFIINVPLSNIFTWVHMVMERPRPLSADHTKSMVSNKVQVWIGADQAEGPTGHLKVGICSAPAK